MFSSILAPAAGCGGRRARQTGHHAGTQRYHRRKYCSSRIRKYIKKSERIYCKPISEERHQYSPTR